MTETHEKRTETHACDLISRAAVLNLIEQSCCDLEYDCDNVALRKEVEALPSAQQWVPVSSGKMPKTGEKVLVTCEHKVRGDLNQYICTAYHVDRFTMESDGNWDEGCDEYHEEDDTFYVLEGWYEVIHNWNDYGSVGIEDTVVAWAELPAPWKGET